MASHINMEVLTSRIQGYLKDDAVSIHSPRSCMFDFNFLRSNGLLITSGQSLIMWFVYSLPQKFTSNLTEAHIDLQIGLFQSWRLIAPRGLGCGMGRRESAIQGGLRFQDALRGTHLHAFIKRR